MRIIGVDFIIRIVLRWRHFNFKSLPRLHLEIIPHNDVTTGLKKQKWDDRKDLNKREQVSWWFPFYQDIMWPAITNHQRGQCSKPNIDHQILIVTWFRTNLKEKIQQKSYFLEFLNSGPKAVQFNDYYLFNHRSK